MGASGTHRPVERAPTGARRRQGNRAAQQSSGVPSRQLPRRGRPRPGGHQQRVGDIRGEAGAHRPAHT